MTHTQQNDNTGHPQSDMNKLRQNMSAVKHKLLVLSGKGGVGKSTVAVNLAAELARKGFKVGLLDVDLHGPSVPRMTGLTGQKAFSFENEILPVKIGENLSVMSIAFLVPDDTQAVIWRGPMKYSVIQKLLADTLWGDLDFLVVDAPPGTGDEPLSVAQLVGANAGAVLVTTPQKLAADDVRRCVTFCRQLHMPIWGVIENMSGLYCPHCEKEIPLFGEHSGGRVLSEQTGVDFLGAVPLDPGIADGADAGLAIAECSVSARVHERMDAILGRLCANIQAGPQAKGKKTMKIAIPIAAGRLSAHFGHCEQFAFVTVNPETKAVSDTQMLQPPAHEPGVLPRWLAENGTAVVIAGGMGQRAQQLFEKQGIKVIIGAPANTPAEIVTAYLDGTLETGQNLCDH